CKGRASQRSASASSTWCSPTRGKRYWRGTTSSRSARRRRMVTPTGESAQRQVAPPAAQSRAVAPRAQAPAAAEVSGLPRLYGGKLLLWIGVVPLVFFLVVPLLVLLGRTAATAGVLGYLSDPVVVGALRLSVVTTLATVVITLLLGTPTAYLLARYRFTGR